jgi:hypothetical protein
MTPKRIWGLVPLLALALPLLAQTTAKNDNPAKGYRSGKALLKQPFRMYDFVAQLCAYSELEQIAVKEKDPHYFKYAQIYVNPKGQASVRQVSALKAKLSEAKSEKMHQRLFKAVLRQQVVFPVGTILVKEKFSNPKGTGTPKLLTAMVKREKGYNPACYDWEFLVLDGKAERVLERGKLARCQSCHVKEEYKRTDGVVTLSEWRLPLALSGSR